MGGSRVGHHWRIQGGTPWEDPGWVNIGGSRVGHHGGSRDGHHWWTQVGSSWADLGESS